MGIGIGEGGDVMYTLQAGQQHGVAFAQNQRNEVREMDKADALPAEPGMKQQTFVGAFSAGQGEKAGGIAYDENVAPPLKSADSGTNRTPTAHVGMAVRRLSVVECALLQGFPALYLHVVVGKRRKIEPDEAAYLGRHGLKVWKEKRQWFTNVPADGPMYKAYGNSMARNVMEWLGRRIKLVSEMPR